MHISHRTTAQHRAATPYILDHRRDEWLPSRNKAAGRVVRLPNDGPLSVPRPPANDNTARIDWPLGKALRADGNDWLLTIAAGYRHIDEQAGTGGLLGKDIGESGFSIDQRTWVNPSGAIIYKGPREVTGGDPPPISPTMGSRGGRKLVPSAWNGDEPLHRKMDALRLLSHIVAALGPLLQPTEDAVVGGWTLEAIGRREGPSDKTRACAVGKALVYRGLGALGDIFSGAKHRVALAELGIRSSV